MIEQRLCIVVEDVKQFTKSRRNQFEIKPESVAAELLDESVKVRENY